MKTMRSQLCVMPAECVKCEQVFDMSYDYKVESVEALTEREAAAKKESKLLCWACRANARRR